MTVTDAVLDEVLSSLDVRLGFGRRVELDSGGILPLAEGTPTLAYLLSGEITGEADAGCALELSDGSAARSSGTRTLLAGDAFLTLGRSPIVLSSASGVELTTVELGLEDLLGIDGMPGFVFVTGFADHEPAAAALAAKMGSDEPTACSLQGDPLICRMMATTVLMSLIRSWVRGGCVPPGWPRERDPYVERVLDAIHADPGRNWTVDLLASVGTMSRSVFAERFRTVIGQSPASYVTEIRIRAAKEMLEAGLLVSRVSRDLGYASDEGFSRAFRRRTGINPSAWRRAAVPA